MKKRIIGMIAVTALTAVMLAGCGTKEGSPSKEGDQLKESDTIIVGTEAGFAPYEYMEGNEVVGVDMDIAQAIAEAMGKKLVIKNMDFDGALLAVQNGTVDFVAAGVSVDEDRLKVMDFSLDYVNSTEVVVVNKATPALDTVSDDALADKVIGVQQGNIADFYVEENISAKKINRYTKFAQAAEDLKNNKIDCIVMDQFPAEELVAANPELSILDGTLFEDKYAIAVKKGNQDLLEEINKIIQELKDNGKIDEFMANHTSK